MYKKLVSHEMVHMDKICKLIISFPRFVCPHCSDCTNIFSKGGGESLAEIAKIPLLGSLPIDPRVGKLLAKSCVKEYPDSPAAQVFSSIVHKIVVK